MCYIRSYGPRCQVTRCSDALAFRPGDGDHLIAPLNYILLRHVHILGLGQIILRRMCVKMSEFERRQQYSFLAGAESLTLLGIRSSVLVISPDSAPTNGTVSKPAVNVGRVTECAGCEKRRRGIHKRKRHTTVLSPIMSKSTRLMKITNTRCGAAPRSSPPCAFHAATTDCVDALRTALALTCEVRCSGLCIVTLPGYYAERDIPTDWGA
ncbi:hypothetical protein EDB84DRAFT_1484685 [Lactarius hengduanensis]|nr:hypothetical protein EDB84DRAFT_1484685 [Lactarius hengduanensis]